MPRVLEVCASARVLEERRVHALREGSGGAVLGRSFLTLRGLAEACAAETEVTISGWLDEAALTRVVQRCVSASPRLAGLINQRPSLAKALAQTLRDLRDAGVSPGALPERAMELRQVLAAYERALHRLAERGLYERVGLFRLAAHGTRGWTERMGFERAQLHGATELVGSAGDLIEALAAVLPLRMIQPDWGGDFARELRESWPWGFIPEPARVVAEPLVERELAAPSGALRSLRTRGVRQELECIAREILCLLDEGTRPAEIHVVARSLESYAAWIEPVFGRHEIPFTSSLSQPVLRLPTVRVWLDLVHALFGDLERGAVLRLLRSPRLASASGQALAQLASWLCRRAAVVQGEDWQVALADAERLAAQESRRIEPRLLDSLRERLADLDAAARQLREARSFRECATRLLQIGDQLLGSAGDHASTDELARGAIRGVALLDDVDKVADVDHVADVDKVADVDAVAGDSEQRPSADELRVSIEQALRSASWQPHSEDNGGVRVLDALQARALATPHLFLIGLDHRNWPRQRREDPFLSDELRLVVRRTTGRPVPAAELAEREERFLLGLLLSQASASLTLTRPCADAWERDLAASAFLRDLPVVTGEHPVHLSELDARPARDADLLSASEALVASALASDPHEQSDTLALARTYLPDSVERFSAGLAHIATTDSHDGRLDYDGVLGSDAPPVPETVSPSFLETLGNCPLKAFFQRLLRVGELDAPAPNVLGAAEAGTVVHALLARLYEELFEAGALRPGTSAHDALERARGLLPHAMNALAPGLRRVLARRHPELWTALQRQLTSAALDFIERDLELLLPEGVSDLRAEEELRLVADPGKFEVGGRVDRVVRSPSGALRVGDYKTSRDPDAFVRRGNVEKGTALQVPLYALAAARSFDTPFVYGEVLSVPLRPERDRRGARERERQLDLETIEASTARPLAVLSELLRDSQFPFREHDGCRYCAYAVACRRKHPSSAQRVAAFAGFAPYFGLDGETS